MSAAATTEKERGIGGRKPHEIAFTKVTYNSVDYCVGTIQKRDLSKVYFVIDAEDEERVKTRSWHVAVGGAYIASSYTSTEGSRLALYLHNFIMEKGFDCKGSAKTIDHINGLGFDNRKVNLREADQSLQNLNTKTRKRTSTKIPKEIDPSEIPRNIWYIPPQGGHGERFAVEIKGIPGVEDICWKSSSSKALSIHEKLTQAIAKRTEFFETYPILTEYSRISEQATRLKKEFGEIIALAVSPDIPLTNEVVLT